METNKRSEVYHLRLTADLAHALKTEAKRLRARQTDLARIALAAGLAALREQAPERIGEVQHGD